MNLLAHYYCTGIFSADMADEGGSVRLALGAALPDLMGMFSRRARPRQLLRHWAGQPAGSEPEDQADAEVLRGVHHHHTVDQAFHHHPLFTELSGELGQALAAASRTGGLKRFLPAHVLSELFLDHLLIGGEPRLPAHFLSALEAQTRDLTRVFAGAYPEDAGEFSAFLGRVIAARFVESYREMDGLFPILQRILGRCRQRPLEAGEMAALRAQLEHSTPRVREQLQTFARQAAGWVPTAGGTAAGARLAERAIA